MIHLDQTPLPSQHVEQRASAMWARKSDEGNGWIEFTVTPFGRKFDHKDKRRRVIRLALDSEGTPITAECSCIANSPFVPGTDDFKRPRLCSHVWRAVKAYKALLERRNHPRAA